MVLAKLIWRMAMGALLLALTLEMVLRMLPVSGSPAAGYYLDPLVLTYPPNRSFMYSTGWDLRNPQRLVANNAGFVSDADFMRDATAIALIGDSHVEAAALQAADRPAAQLQRLLGPTRRVYAMGSPGTSLLDYAERVRLADLRYGVRDMVILVDIGDVRQSLCGSGQIAAPCLDAHTGQAAIEKQPEASSIKRVVRHSALAQYLFSQLKIAPDRLWPALRALPSTLLPGHGSPAPGTAAATPGNTAAEPPTALLDAVTRTFFERIRPHVHGRLVIVIDRPLPGRDASRLPVADSDRFAAQARAMGATVVDMAGAYAEYAATSPLTLAVGPYDWHHNKLGAGLLARQMARGLVGAGD
jgi:hypothetical protein